MIFFSVFPPTYSPLTVKWISSFVSFVKKRKALLAGVRLWHVLNVQCRVSHAKARYVWNVLHRAICAMQLCVVPVHISSIRANVASSSFHFKSKEKSATHAFSATGSPQARHTDFVVRLVRLIAEMTSAWYLLLQAHRLNAPFASTSCTRTRRSCNCANFIAYASRASMTRFVDVPSVVWGNDMFHVQRLR